MWWLLGGPVGCEGSWCHLDFTRRDRAVLFLKGLASAVGALPLGFAGQVGAGPWYVSPCWPPCCRSFLCLLLVYLCFGAATVRAVWSTKMPLADTPALLNLLDGPVVVDPAFHIIWSRVSHDAQVSCLLS